MIFFDASALAKLYLEEEESEVMHGALKLPKQRLLLSEFVALEVLTAIRSRMRAASKASFQTMVAAFWMHYPTRYNVVEVTPEVRQLAIQLAMQYRSTRARGMDLLHLATALEFQAEAGVPVTLVTSDHDLAELARLCGLRTFDPSREPLAALPRRRR